MSGRSPPPSRRGGRSGSPDSRRGASRSSSFRRQQSCCSAWPASQGCSTPTAAQTIAAASEAGRQQAPGLRPRACTSAQGGRCHRRRDAGAHHGAGATLFGSADAVGEGHRCALQRHAAGAADHAGPRRLPRHGVVCDVGHRGLDADAEGPDRQRPGRRRAALGARQDRLTAGPDRRSPGADRRPDEARDGAARANRPPLGPARRLRSRRRDSGDARGPQGRSPQRAGTGAGRSGPGERGSTVRDDPAEPADVTVLRRAGRADPLGPRRSTEPARSSCSKR